MGTSGNFSAVVHRHPLRLAITASTLHKGKLTADGILEIDEAGGVVAGEGRPSAETRLHLDVVKRHGAGAVLHTHSVWSTRSSEISTKAKVVWPWTASRCSRAWTGHNH